MNEPDTVTIMWATYKRLSNAEDKLHRLIAGGVENWEWYDACFEDEEEEDDD